MGDSSFLLLGFLFCYLFFFLKNVDDWFLGSVPNGFWRLCLPGSVCVCIMLAGTLVTAGRVYFKLGLLVKLSGEGGCCYLALVKARRNLKGRQPNDIGADLERLVWVWATCGRLSSRQTRMSTPQL